MTTLIKERPIIFGGEMVRAIRDGRKTQTRRIVKPQPNDNDIALYGNGIKAHKLEHYETGCPAGYGFENEDYQWRCPYGAPGERLWVRENFYNDFDNVYYPADSRSKRWCCDLIPECCCAEVGKPKVTPSIHMPRWASRITLEVTDVRVERLNEISEEDAKAEGVTNTGPYDCRPGFVHRVMFEDLWNRIHGVDSWDANPFVWVVAFTRIELTNAA